MTKVQSVQIACALRACVRFLAKPGDYHRYGGDNCNEFVCWAIDVAESRGLITTETADATKNMIEQRLDHAHNVQHWLTARGGVSFGCMSEKKIFDVMQDYRHRWVEAMAKEYFAMGEDISKQLQGAYHE